MDTIAAIASGGVKSAIGIIRLSGGEAVGIAARLFKPQSGLELHACPPRRIIYGTLVTACNEVIDHCLAVVSRAPSSYTGEDCVELQCHGSPAVLTKTLNMLLEYGAKLAAPGEFTKRAFLNGKLDLIQAEAVADLIDADTDAALINSAAQLGGAVSRGLDELYSGLLDVCAHFHAIIDYPDEDIDPFDELRVLEILRNAETKLRALRDSFERGRVIKNGVKCAIIGRPNVGKSSLLNAILGYERAIVTDIPGTTRDTIEEKIILGGVLLRLTDTAGIRDTSDEVEAIGISRSLAAAGDAELVFAVFDGSEPISSSDYAVIGAAVKAPKSIAVINKSDLSENIDAAAIETAFGSICRVSALGGRGLDALDRAVAEFFGESAIPAGEIITNARQFAAVLEAQNAASLAIAALENGLTPDAALLDVEAALDAIGSLSGKTLREDIVSRIFERFCVGK